VPYPDSGRDPELIRWKEYKTRLLAEPAPEGSSEPLAEASEPVAETP
jgi:hypothetical protein